MSICYNKKRNTNRWLSSSSVSKTPYGLSANSNLCDNSWSELFGPSKLIGEVIPGYCFSFSFSFGSNILRNKIERNISDSIHCVTSKQNLSNSCFLLWYKNKKQKNHFTTGLDYWLPNKFVHIFFFGGGRGLHYIFEVESMLFSLLLGDLYLFIYKVILVKGKLKKGKYDTKLFQIWYKAVGEEMQKQKMLQLKEFSMIIQITSESREKRIY